METKNGFDLHTVAAGAPVISDMREKLSDILQIVSWREIARSYFGKSSSWLYHKIDGIDGNGGKGGFTESEAKRMREVLLDLSERIRNVAESICPQS